MFLVSCNNKSVREDDGIYRTFVRDSVFQRAVEDYAKEKSAQLGRENFAICAYFKNFEDSIVRCVLSCGVNPEKWDTLPFHFVCKVAGEDVFFVMCGGGIGNPFQHDFKRSDDDLKRFRAIYYPNPVKKTPGGQVAVCICHPDVCFLTFVNGRLVDKCYQKGMPSQKVKVKIDGKEYLW